MAHGQCKNSQVTSQTDALNVIKLDGNIAVTLDMLDC